MDDAQTGAMTDVMYDGWMDETYDAQTSGTYDIMYYGWMDGDFTGISCR